MRRTVKQNDAATNRLCSLFEHNLASATRDDAELLHQPQIVAVAPALDDPAIGDAIEADPDYLAGDAGRWAWPRHWEMLMRRLLPRAGM
jgi:hypothetical protein